jgi:hypothetical protein
MSQMLEASGRLVVGPGEVRINIDTDFCRYYRKLLLDATCESPRDFQTPKHGAHITVISKKIHGNTDTSSLADYDGSTTPFKYSPVIVRGGTRFVTYYVKVECLTADFIKRKLGVIDGKNYLGLHVCICNNKAIWKNSKN